VAAVEGEGEEFDGAEDPEAEEEETDEDDLASDPEARRSRKRQTTPFDEAADEVLGRLQPKISRWEEVAKDGRIVVGYGAQASRLASRVPDDFARELRRQGLVAEEGGAGPEEAAEELQGEVERQLQAIFFAQRALVEQAVYKRLKADLLRRMRRKKRALIPKERANALQRALKEYDGRVKDLIPSFMPERGAERALAEQTLAQLAATLDELPEAKDLLSGWRIEQLRRQSRGPRGISVSFSPGLRIMMRPDGFGNLQLNTKRQVGPPNNPNEVSLAVLNDGNVMDVYRKQPKPPLFKFQPTVAMDVSLS